ncbi:MAG: sigma-70 family RNA polymerase sigma factor [Verrucomicrobiales bacterium]|nr:sigma-70 family RNA polymerase sigma factor [Verrucomicrobiales bacterium]
MPVLGYLVRLAGNVADARDLLQLTNLTAWDKRDTFEQGTNFVAWMRAIARNHYRNESRKARSRRTVPLLDSDLEQMVEARHEEREKEETRKRRLLKVCLEKLPEKQREAVEKFYLEGFSLEDVGKETNRKVNAVAQVLHRARRNLIDCVRRQSHLGLDRDELQEM